MGGSSETYQMPTDPSAAMASNAQSQNALQAMNLGSPDQFIALKGITPINTHPEQVAEAGLGVANKAAKGLKKAAAMFIPGGQALAAADMANSLPTQDQANTILGQTPDMASWRTLQPNN
jgi:hypothetical protein